MEGGHAHASRDPGAFARAWGERSLNSIWRFFKRQGLSFKKTLHAAEQDWPDVAQARDIDYIIDAWQHAKWNRTQFDRCA